MLTLLCCITLSSSRKTNASSRRSKKDFWRCCRGGLRSSQDIPSTLTNPSPSHLHYLPFAPRFPLPHFTLAILFALSFPVSSLFRLPSCVLFAMASPPIIVNSPDHEVLNFKQREGENLKDAWHRICNAQNRPTSKQSTSVLLRNFYLGITP